MDKLIFFIIHKKNALEKPKNVRKKVPLDKNRGKVLDLGCGRVKFNSRAQVKNKLILSIWTISIDRYTNCSSSMV